MPDSRFLGQLLLTGVPGPVLDSDTAARFKKLQPGGFILFGRNIQSPEQLRKLIDDLRDISDIEPFITIDQEGGRVSRLRLIGEEPPNAQALRDKGDPNLIKTHGRLTGQLLRHFGFNLDLCPVLDISYDDTADNSLKGRCYGRDPQEAMHDPRIDALSRQLVRYSTKVKKGDFVWIDLFDDCFDVPSAVGQSLIREVVAAAASHGPHQ
jgi:beta-glucosidase-like glycosyl hydrolase